MVATKTLTTTHVAADNIVGAEQHAKIVSVIRNMGFLKLRGHENVVVPIRTEAHPSPIKQAASNRQPGQSHTRTTVDEAINHELTKARYLMDDLADHVFGHIVSTDLAKDILRQFVDDGIIQVFEGTISRSNRDNKVALDPNSDDVQYAIKQAFEDADKHDCIRPDAEGNIKEPGSSPEDATAKGKRKDSKEKGKQKHRTYSFKWNTFPTEPIGEDELVSFLNDVTDRAFAFAKPKLSKAYPKLSHRFAAREDQHHGMPLSYEADGEDMRPDFLVLPIEAFKDDFKTVDPRYINFTASRLVGELKNKDLAAGVEQVQRYARGLKRAQPWVHYVLAMTITRDKAVFIRGEGSGTERLELMLADGRGCIEFIRILLGLALADKVDLGHNPDVEVDVEARMCEGGSNNTNQRSTATISRATRAAGSDLAVSSSSDIPSSKGRSRSTRVRSTSAKSRAHPVSSGTCTSTAAFKALPVSSHTRSASAATKTCPSTSYVRISSASLRRQAITASSTSSKRVYSEIAEGDHEGVQPKRRKVIDTVTGKEERIVFYPIRVYGHTCLGILFTSSSIRGRGTTVFCVLDLTDEKKRMALKMSWQDLERKSDQDAVTKRLEEHKLHPNVIVPTNIFNAEKNGKICTTLGAIRGFLDEQIEDVHVENRMLVVTVSELKRPVKYFWGLHDFVRGLRGALLGHEFLTRIGILHRDISENNIVLGVFPWEERGYLIDFDMAILQDAEKPTGTHTLMHASGNQVDQPGERSCMQTVKANEKKHVKGLRTGTFPYISFNVLLGERHTHFDDVESFLYVLLLFFFSYAGPLAKEELEHTHDKGFVRPIGSGRLSHIRGWPKKYADWANGDPQVVGRSKAFDIWDPFGETMLIQSPELEDCLKNNWPEGLHSAIKSLLMDSFKLFCQSTLQTTPKRRRTEVSHAQFIHVLDEWLVTNSALENDYSNCPDFKDFRKT